MKLLLWISVIFIMIGCVGNIPSADNNQQSNIVEITTQKGDSIMLKRIGEEFDVNVSVQNATDVIGLNAYISYDPAIIEPVDPFVTNDLGFFSSSQLLVDFEKDGNNDDIPGSLVCGYVSLPPAPTSGDGDMFSIRFKAIAQGNTDIDFSVLNLQDNDGDIPTDGIADSVEVPVNATVTITVL